MIPLPIPLWLNGTLLAALPATAGYWMFGPSLRRRLRKAVREELIARRVPVCIQCGYDLRGQKEPRCPECGHAFDPHLFNLLPSSKP